jgi:hypothetical protein
MPTTLQRTHIRTTGTVELIVGLWLIIAPFIFGFNTAAMWSALISGVVLAVVALILFSTVGTTSTWPTWVSLIVGAWLLIAPLIVSYNSVATWNGLIAGIIVAGVALWVLMGGREQMP